MRDMKAYTWNRKRTALGDYPYKVSSAGDLPDLDESLKQIGEYQRRLRANGRRSLLLVVHGPDASGKDSLIRTLATYMDPTGFHAWSFSRPSGMEQRHDFLWRIVPCLPAAGEVAAFNRSHHEAVMAERLWPVHDPDSYDWAGRYDAIRAFERHLVREGTQVIKIWLNVSENEQAKRLLKRLEKARKRWKFDGADLEAWRRREDYHQIASEAITATHADKAPWWIIPGDNKPEARALVAAALAERLATMAPDYPPPDEDALSAYRTLLADRYRNGR
ncbi:polyphosphate kinase [Tamilnaduibacter salinus]|uniref:Polyphosphate kinase n=2 Tax=Tamilnaduibacter salinus TaxID=1484056 RepID=A0A2A2I4L8_9GAMM|nr:polyphosphate kinase [Tamilnaduibacter salinus]